ncbi:ATP-grasp domain-containing protein [Alkaliphilus sp. B6464]|uniref:ATP-grasp domain-containing protein n=1 Tax=Alkaliphilus sp. B6464 TaxID=2731219 RepID=UPI001BA4C220|nr:ATP-grasp domain-containing protein [Alkaliphilus sp. B6464]QUH18589.1 ATP-grasp domain-containing protein [Alkaliphilus sp. B6464]
MNLLFTSSGRRTQLIKYFKQELGNEGRIIVADYNSTAPTLYIADKGYIVSSIDNSNYLNEIKEICTKEDITGIIATIDPELSLLAKEKEEFNNLGVQVIISDYDIVEMCFDKYSMFKFLKNNGFNTPKTYSNLDDFMNALNKNKIDFPVFVKPREGSASIGINKVSTLEELKILMKYNTDLIVQQYMQGQEYGVDIYVDIISKDVISIFLKKKISMRGGETDKAVSVKNDKLFNMILDFIKKLKVVGPVDIDVFEIDGEFYISEVNPRFGGGYLIAYECGENFPKYILNNLKGIINTSHIDKYEEGIYMMRHDIVTIKKRCELLQ